MPFIKGQSGNPAGRPKGVKNNSHSMAQVLKEQSAHLNPAFARLLEESPKDYILAVVALAEVVIELRGNGR